MSQRSFPKPPPESPLPLDRYLDRTDRAEVGRSAFFCGRDFEYEVFRRTVIRLNTGDVGGGTMLFQGAPGAGKTALMLECMEAVRRHSTPDNPWVAVSVSPGTLISPVGVIAKLIVATNEESKRLSRLVPNATARRFTKLLELGAKLYEDLSARGVSISNSPVSGKPEVNNSPEPTPPSESVFRSVSPLLKKFRLVIFVDEAQNIPIAQTTQDVLDCLHRGVQGIPLVATFFGLSDTQDVLRECGLSRFSDQRVVNLEPLSIEDASGSFRHLFDTYFTGDEKEKDVWANSLAKFSQGWPQHVNRIGVAVGQVLSKNEGLLERSLLEEVLIKGTERKNDYYLGRIEAGSNRAWVYRQLALTADKKKEQWAGTISYDEIDRLTEAARSRKDETIDEFLKNALHAGLLAPARGLPDHYKIPIPSLGDYLRALPVEPPSVV